MNSNAKKCSYIKKKCRTCGADNPDRVAACPNCGADLRCGNYPVAGYTLCSFHGGPNPSAGFYGKGPMSTGASSSFPIMRLASKYREVQKNGNVLSNRAAIDIVDVRVRQLLERVDLGEAPDRVIKLYSLWQEYRAAQSAGRTDDEMTLRAQIDNVFEAVYHDYKAWEQVFGALDVRRKMVESELKILKEIKAIITAEDAYELAAKLLAASMNVIGDDPLKLKRLQYEYTRIIGERSDLAGEASGGDDWGTDEESGGETGSGGLDQEELLHPRDEA